jgi:hypothetical protein
MSESQERLRLKESCIRLQLPAHIEGVVLERYPMSKSIGMRFFGKYGDTTAIVREDQVEPIPPEEKLGDLPADDKSVAVDMERVEEIGTEAVAAEIVAAADAA